MGVSGFIYVSEPRTRPYLFPHGCEHRAQISDLGPFYEPCPDYHVDVITFNA